MVRIPKILGLAGFLLMASACQRDKPAVTEASEPELAEDFLDTIPAATPLDTTSGSWHRLAKRTNPNAPLLSGRSLRGVIKLPPGVPPPPEAELHDITLKASEYFRIDPTQASEVHGREGTIVRIPAGSLVTEKQAPARGPVWVELKECYSMADILLSNLSTVSDNNDLLETGGIVLVQASAQGQPLRVAEGQTIQIDMPAPRRQPGMRLSRGLGDRRKLLRWVALTPEAEPAEEKFYTEPEKMPAYGKGPADINKLIRYPKQAIANQTQGLVFAAFVVDEAGRVVNPKIVRGIGDGCDEELLRVLRQTSGSWKPGLQAGKAVKVKMVLPVRFAFYAGLASSLDSTANTEATPDSTMVLANEEMPPSEPSFKAEPTDRYLFSSAQLGWLNCDRVWHATGNPSTDLLATADTDPGTSVYLVFREAKTLITGQPEEGGYAFRNVPANKRAVLIGIRYQNDVPFVALRETTTGRHATEALAFRETTLEELERMLERLK
ncbi:energy transducer TonB [Hymenobacter qilianensis]|nr:energy transducer TonB [Hymenobacter qilianensis]